MLRRRYGCEIIPFVAIDGTRIVGLVMGTRNEFKRLFVDGGHQRSGMGRRLVACFEAECLRQGGTRYRIVAGLSAVPFYERVGCKKTTGMRNAEGLRVQPMRRDLGGSATPGRAAMVAPRPSRERRFRPVATRHSRGSATCHEERRRASCWRRSR